MADNRDNQTPRRSPALFGFMTRDLLPVTSPAGILEQGSHAQGLDSGLLDLSSGSTPASQRRVCLFENRTPKHSPRSLKTSHSTGTKPKAPRNKASSNWHQQGPNGFSAKAITVHWEDCEVYGIQTGFEGLDIPAWSRGENRDFTLHHSRRRGACQCHQYVGLANAQYNTIAPTAAGGRIGKDHTKAFFLYEVDRPTHAEIEGACALYLKNGCWTLRIDPSLRDLMAAYQSLPDCEGMYVPMTLRPHDAQRVAQLRTEAITVFNMKAEVANELAQGIVPLTPPSQAVSHVPNGSPRVRLPGRAPVEGYLSDLMHVGDHSIEGAGAAALAPVEYVTTCNVLRWVANRLTRDGNFAQPTEDNQGFQFTSTISGGDTLVLSRTVTVSDEFKYWSKVARQHEIRAVGTEIVGQLDTLQLSQAFTPSGLLDVKRVQGLLESARGFQGTGKGAVMAPYFNLALMKYDNTSFYAKGWCLAMLRQAITDRGGYDPQWLPTTTTYFKVRTWEADTSGHDLGTDVANGRFIYDANNVGSSMINCMMHLSRPGPSLPVRPNVANPIMGLTHWFGIEMTVVGVPALAADDVTARDFTPAQMFETLRMFACLRGEMEMLAMGFLKASVYFNTIVKTLPRDGEFQQYSTGESMERVEWLKPRSHNFTWDLMGLYKMETQPPHPILPKSEVDSLGTVGPTSMLKTGAAVAALVSLGVGLALNRMNITGQVMNAVAGPNITHPDFSLLRNSYFGAIEPADHVDRISLVFTAATSELRAHVGVDFPRLMWKGSPYNGRFQAAAPTGDRMWAAAYGHRTPYPLKPLSLAGILTSWPAVFGVFTGQVKGNFEGEVVEHGSLPGWYAHHGCADYDARGSGQAEGSVANVYICYGLHCLNALSQSSSTPVRVPYMWQAFGPDLNRGRLAPEFVNVDPLEEGDFLAEVGMYSPGFLRTYDYVTRSTLAPVVMRDQCPPGMFTALARNVYRQGIPYAGVLASGIPTQRSDNALVIDLRRALGLGPSGAAGDAGGPPIGTFGVGNVAGPAPPADVPAGDDANAAAEE